MGNPAAERHKNKSKASRQFQARLSEKQALDRIRLDRSAEVARVISGATTTRVSNFAETYGASVRVARVLGLDHGPPAESLGRYGSKTVSVGVVASSSRGGFWLRADSSRVPGHAVRIGLESVSVGDEAGLAELLKSELGTIPLVVVEQRLPSQLAAAASSIPKGRRGILAGETGGSRVPAWLKRIIRRTAALRKRAKRSQNVLLGGHAIESIDPTIGFPGVSGTITVGVNSGSGAHHAVTCEHVAHGVGRQIHHPSYVGGQHVGHVATVMGLFGGRTPTMDAALVAVQGSWQSRPAIHGVGDVVICGYPVGGQTYELLGQQLGYGRATLNGIIVTRLRVAIPGGGTVLFANQSQYELDRSAGQRIQPGDSGAPVFHRLTGQAAVELVSMVYAYDDIDPAIFYAMPFPDVATALGVSVP